jgi:hypothetical protein
LKCRYHVRINEASIAEKHGSQHGGALRLVWKKAVEARQHVSAHAREALRKSGLRAANEL